MKISIIMFLLCVVCAAHVIAAPLSSSDAIERARVWMQGHPIMGVAAGRAVQAVTAFPDDTPPECVYVVELSQGGYLVLTADDRLAPVIAFDAASTVNLEDRPDNAFRAFLAHYAAGLPASLDALPANTSPYQVRSFALLAGATQYGPYTETGWTQWHPYNLLCPVGGSLSGYQGRVPVGCTPVAWAQVMGYHFWPLYGHGTHSYTDTEGAMHGFHSTDFSIPINWGNMLNTYSTSVSPTQQGQADIAALMYKLGVAANINYEGDGSGASILTLGNQIRDHLYYDTYTYHSSATPALFTAMKNDLRAGYPCVIAIPGHAIVADGLLDDGTETYHVNYGWAGQNDGWCTGGNTPGGAIEYGATGIRPRLMAFPCDDAVVAASGEPVTLEWILPRRREHEASSILIKRLVQGSWVDFVQDTALNAHRATRVSTTLDNFTNLTTFFQSDAPGAGTWLITSVDDVPNCAYLDVSSTSGWKVRMLRSTATITPNANSVLSIRWKRYLASPMYVEVSSSSAGPWTQITSFNDRAAWQTEEIPLSAYAGQPVYIRFNPISGSAYADGGIWIDSVSLQSVTNGQYEKQPIHYTELTTSLVGTHTLRAVVVDANGLEHDAGPEFTLTVTASAPLPADAVRITAFEPFGNGQFMLSWVLNPALQDAVIEVIGNTELSPNGWHTEPLTFATPTSATIAPASNRFFRVKAQ